MKADFPHLENVHSCLHYKALDFTSFYRKLQTLVSEGECAQIKVEQEQLELRSELKDKLNKLKSYEEKYGTSFVFAEYIPFNPYREKRNFAFFIGRGDIVAFGKPTTGNGLASLTAMGVSGVNEYADLWRRREIYAD